MNKITQTIKEREEEFENSGMIQVMKQASDFNKAQFDLLMKLAKYHNTKTTSLIIDAIVETLEEWKKGSCMQCGGNVPNFNCKGHAYVDIRKTLLEVKKTINE